jgi:hypothetical protein
MYIDRTEEFYTIVNELKKSRIADSDLHGGSEGDLFDLEEQDNDETLGIILKFHKLSRNVNICIARMDNLVDNRFTAYVAVAQNNFLSLDTPRLSVAEKEEVDSIVEDFCKASNLQLKEISILANTSSKRGDITLSQVKHCKHVVLFLTKSYKRIVKKIHTMKKTFASELKKQDEPLCPDELPNNIIFKFNNSNTNNEKTNDYSSISGSDFLGSASIVASIGGRNGQNSKQGYGDKENSTINTQPKIMNEMDINNIDDVQLRNDIEQENRLMMAEHENDFEEAKIMETKMIEIAEMTQVFGSAVKEQHEMIERIGDEVEDSVQNVVRGNKQLVKAEENTGTGSRFLVYVLLILSFILLFLDYYM